MSSANAPFAREETLDHPEAGGPDLTLGLAQDKLADGATLLGQGDIAGKDCVLRFKRDGRMLAIASIFRDHESLQAELSMERGIAQADQRNA
jgi:hypothetical protein